MGALTTAFKGAEAVFILPAPVFDPQPGFAEAYTAMSAHRDAVRAANVARVLYLSTIGAQARQTYLLSQHTIGEGLLYSDFLCGAPPTSAYAAFIKESRMKFSNASKLDRKPGVRCCERGAPVEFPPTLTVTHGSRTGCGVFVSPDVGESLESPASICDPKQADVA